MEPVHSQWRYCPFCGAGLAAEPPTECGGCGKSIYFNSQPCVGVVAVRRTEFLALRRSREPWRGYWDLPGGFCDQGEHPEDAARREAREETGLEVEILGLAGIYLDTYPFQGQVLSILNLYYAARVIGSDVPRVVDSEASEVGWLAVSDHPRLAFNHQEQALRDAVRQFVP